MASNTGGGTPFPKWQLAVAIGATSAIGLGFWYLRSQSQKPKKAALKETKASLSLDETPEEDKHAKESPLEQATRHKIEGNTCFKKGKYDEAITMYNKAIAACPEEFKTDLATFYQNRAAAYEQLKKWSAVISDCTKALEYNKKYEKALYRRAKAEEYIKDWKSCLDDITAVCLLQNFQSQNALLMADRVLKELGREHAAEAMKTRKPKLPSKQFIKTYFFSFSEDLAHKKLVEVGEPIGTGNVTGFLRAKLEFAAENFDEMIAACTEEVDSSESESPYLLEALSIRATFYLLSGAHKEAFEDLNALIDSNDADVKIKVNALIKRASLHMQTEKQDECLKDFEVAAQLGPEISDVFHHRGQVNLLMDNTEKAREDFERAVSLNPDFAIACVQKCYADYRYALLTQNVNLLMKNMEQFRTATEKYPNSTEVFVLYAQVLTEKQEYEKAEELYQKAVVVDPKNATIQVHRGLLQLQWKGDVEKAVELMRSAIKLDEKCEFAYETLGTVEVQRGNLVIAVDLFNKAIELARTELEMTHLFSLRDAAVSQLKVTTELGIGPQILKASS